MKTSSSIDLPAHHLKNLVENKLDFTQIGFVRLPALNAQEALSIMGLPRSSPSQQEQTEKIFRSYFGNPRLFRRAYRWRLPLLDLDLLLEAGVIAEQDMDTAA